MFLLIALCLFSQTPADPPVTTPPPTTTQTSALRPAVKAALEQQRKELEYQQKELAFQRKELEIQRKELGNHNEDLRRQREDLEFKIKQGLSEATKDVLKWKTFVYTFLTLLGLNALGAIKIRRELKNQFNAYIKEELKKQSQSLFSVIQNYDSDQKLKAGTRIKIIGTEGSYNLQGLLMQWGFERVTTNHPKQLLEKMDRDAFDVLLFDRLTEAPIKEILAEMPDQVCVAYSPDGHLKDVKSERLNFANSQITLFSRILETARFHRDNKG